MPLALKNTSATLTPTSKACCSKVALYMNNMNVIIADDHPIVLFGIRKSLEQIEWVNVVGSIDSDLKSGVTAKGLEIKFYGGVDGASGYVLLDDKSIFVSTEHTDTSALNCLVGRVVEVVPSRHGFEVVVDAGEKIFVAVTAESIEHLAIVQGKEVWLSFKASSIRFIEA